MMYLVPILFIGPSTGRCKCRHAPLHAGKDGAASYQPSATSHESSVPHRCYVERRNAERLAIIGHGDRDGVRWVLSEGEEREENVSRHVLSTPSRR